ncbi:uncharacterized protein EAF01_010654 [Botrytis porri]|uniref:uncharacterized protein n=1 Tax=Botrytis porri TaxID=87229 RepID=UPI001902591E|nr:uncharacterized protein EAF01_010654 [Botrytis porri]KAF7890845.1 hypothetical protein EAF01_010654 [Botrytis porri]
MLFRNSLSLLLMNLSSLLSRDIKCNKISSYLVVMSLSLGSHEKSEDAILSPKEVNTVDPLFSKSTTLSCNPNDVNLSKTFRSHHENLDDRKLEVVFSNSTTITFEDQIATSPSNAHTLTSNRSNRCRLMARSFAFVGTRYAHAHKHAEIAYRGGDTNS